jgi:hypothetical protein
MEHEFTPEPEPSGSLEPPKRYPPTAVGTGTPNPDPEGESAAPPRARRRLPSSAMIMLQLLVAVPVLGFKLGRSVVRRLISR